MIYYNQTNVRKEKEKSPMQQMTMMETVGRFFEAGRKDGILFSVENNMGEIFGMFEDAYINFTEENGTFMDLCITSDDVVFDLVGKFNIEKTTGELDEPGFKFYNNNYSITVVPVDEQLTEDDYLND